MANIRTARRSGRVFRGGRNVRESAWIGVTGTLSTIGAGSSAVFINSLNAAALALTPFTVVRSRGLLFIKSDQSAAAENQAAVLGVAVVSDQAVAVGITALPTPVTDESSDLFYVYQAIMSAHGAGTVDSETGKVIEYDSRAMRKVEDGQDIAYILETEVVALTQGVQMRHTGRFLIKLH